MKLLQHITFANMNLIPIFGAVIVIQWYGSWIYLCYQCLSITTKVVSLGFVLYTILCKFYALLKLANGSLHQYT
jgi:hypothetical protein